MLLATISTHLCSATACTRPEHKPPLSAKTRRWQRWLQHLLGCLWGVCGVFVGCCLMREGGSGGWGWGLGVGVRVPLQVAHELLELAAAHTVHARRLVPDARVIQYQKPVDNLGGSTRR
jgi:hypothetical protein